MTSQITHKDFQNPLASKNVLHEFATYNTLFTLSGVNEQELESGDFLTNPIHDVVARSGGIGENTNVTNSGEPFKKTANKAMLTELFVKHTKILKEIILIALVF